MILYKAGYTSHCPKSLLAAAERHNALIIDIRLSPFSRHPRWNWKAMQEFFGDRYALISDWGNKNYKSGGKIELANWEEGLRLFKCLTAERGYENCILLCACRAETECHRVIVGKKLAEEGYEVRSLLWLKPTMPKVTKKKEEELCLPL